MLKVGDRVFWNYDKKRLGNLRDYQGTILNIVNNENEIRFDNGMDYSYREFDEKNGRRIIYKVDSVNPNSNIIIKE